MIVCLEEFSHLGMADLGSFGFLNVYKIWVLLFLVNLFLWGLDFLSFYFTRGLELFALENGFSYFPKVVSFFLWKLTLVMFPGDGNCLIFFLLWFCFRKFWTSWSVLSSVTLFSFWNMGGASDLNPFFLFFSFYLFSVCDCRTWIFRKKNFSLFPSPFHFSLWCWWLWKQWWVPNSDHALCLSLILTWTLSVWFLHAAS